MGFSVRVGFAAGAIKVAMVAAMAVAMALADGPGRCPWRVARPDGPVGWAGLMGRSDGINDCSGPGRRRPMPVRRRRQRAQRTRRGCSPAPRGSAGSGRARWRPGTSVSAPRRIRRAGPYVGQRRGVVVEAANGAAQKTRLSSSVAAVLADDEVQLHTCPVGSGQRLILPAADQSHHLLASPSDLHKGGQSLRKRPMVRVPVGRCTGPGMTAATRERSRPVWLAARCSASTLQG